ncbi:hypothetical protein LCGC14_2368020 [marine sediment metagenome]|uniref:Uncharacterized protein n=1 Tax=marine sediment metagenome TaxID=412755 RepID=A0A0F9EH21_9ZZZZ
MSIMCGERSGNVSPPGPIRILLFNGVESPKPFLCGRCVRILRPWWRLLFRRRPGDVKAHVVVGNTNPWGTSYSLFAADVGDLDFHTSRKEVGRRLPRLSERMRECAERAAGA